MIIIVNYGLGNVHAFANIYKRLNIPAVIASSPEELLAADKIILPGVGAFDLPISRLTHFR
jgi:glutamine amidotransferase